MAIEQRRPTGSLEPQNIDYSLLPPNKDDLTPEEFSQIIPLGIEEIIQLRERRKEVQPEIDTPLLSLIDKLRRFPNPWREPFIRRAMKGIIEEGVRLDLSRLDIPVDPPL